ncbi:alpha-amylase family protein [Marihabitans asiaticum]|uniref:Amylosucrase n=1 Tax=Marihabitans asiaticum TaxID=415218 RepID=A0A560W9T4_9MICO|nr:amylosucrase [Marihabitans asiaticum]TWD14393.1 amylosucrase [Marihabitans asiaticum]
MPTTPVPPERREMLAARVRRWQPDLRAGLVTLYGDAADSLTARLVTLAERAYAERSDELHRLDLERMLRPDWLQDPTMIGYACYVDRFAGDLRGVADRVDHLSSLGVRYLHLMPFMATRDGADDGGYAISDYTRVREDLGTMDDLAALTATFRGQGISLVADLVLNHVAREHEWARRARSGEQQYRQYFHVFPDRTMPDAYEETLIEVFPDFAPGSFTWDDELDGWVWTTFNSWQWDLNWSNPEVLLELAEVVLELANHGVEVLRLDAIAFMWKRMGTTCQGEPEVHTITQVLRALARIVCPAVAFKAEAIVAPSQLLPYLGQGAHSGRVSELAYHNTLMVQVWSMLAAQDVRLAAHTLSSLPPKPAAATWITYLRCHDDIGWAIEDDLAGAVGVTGPGHRHFLADWYTGAFPGSAAEGLTFQENLETGDRRTSGTAASLIGVARAEREGGSAPVAALRLAHAVVLGYGGIPVIWSGDEIAQPNDEQWAQDPRHAADNRWAGRPALDDARLARAADPTTVPGQVMADLSHLVATRAGLPHLHASVETQVQPVDNPGVLVLAREHPLGRMVQVYNVTGGWRPWPGHRVRDLGVADAVDEITGDPIPWGGDDQVWLPPFAALWLLAAQPQSPRS